MLAETFQTAREYFFGLAEHSSGELADSGHPWSATTLVTLGKLLTGAAIGTVEAPFVPEVAIMGVVSLPGRIAKNCSAAYQSNWTGANPDRQWADSSQCAGAVSEGILVVLPAAKALGLGRAPLSAVASNGLSAELELAPAVEPSPSSWEAASAAGENGELATTFELQTRPAPREYVALDNNALVNAIEGDGVATQALRGRTPVVSPQAAREFAAGSPKMRADIGAAATRRQQLTALRGYLKQQVGRLGPASTPEGRAVFEAKGAKTGDPAVLDSAAQEGLQLMTRDKKLLNKFPDATEKF